MEYNKLVSVVMPVHNGERFLRETIESVLNQTYTNFEFLIIENCSTDSSVDIIKSYNDPRIHLVIETDCGQVQAYNRGFKEAKGEYIFIHDQDDISHPQRFEKQLNCMIENNVDICGSFIKLIDKKGVLKSYQNKKVDDEEIRKELLYKSTAVHNSAICINRTVFNKVGYLNRKFYPVADCEFYMRASFSDFTFRNIPEYLYSYRRHALQITAGDKKKSLIIFRNIALKYLVKNNIIENKFLYRYKGLINYYTNHLLFAFINFLFAVLYGDRSKISIRYLIIIVLLGLPLSIIRHTKFIESKHFVNLKLFFNRILNF